MKPHACKYCNERFDHTWQVAQHVKFNHKDVVAQKRRWKTRKANQLAALVAQPTAAPTTPEEIRLAKKRAYNKAYRAAHPDVDRTAYKKRKAAEYYQRKKARKQAATNGAAVVHHAINVCPNCGCNIAALQVALTIPTH